MKRKTLKIGEALERLEDRIRRTPNEQIELLKARPGKSRKEVIRLKKQISLGWGNARGLQQYRQTERKDK